ncbi:MAG: hypothetical protein WC635_13315 [Bacteriovorax sp.]|jgi:ZIP family zinc transporter
MGGLFLGLIGGMIAGGATTVGALPILFKNKYQNPLLKMKLDFFIGLLLTTTALNNISLSVVISIILGIIFVKSSKLMIDNIFMESIALNPSDKKSVFIILLLILKNIPEGMAAGASLSLSHTGLGHSILSAIVIQDLFDGLTAALCFLSLGLSPLFAFAGAVGTGIVEFFSGIFGGYMGHEIAELLPLIIAFAGGAMISSAIEEVLIKAKDESKKIVSNPHFVSGMIVMLILIIWKELL